MSVSSSFMSRRVIVQFGASDYRNEKQIYHHICLLTNMASIMSNTYIKYSFSWWPFGCRVCCWTRTCSRRHQLESYQYTVEDRLCPRSVLVVLRDTNDIVTVDTRYLHRLHVAVAVLQQRQSFHSTLSYFRVDLQTKCDSL